MSTTVFTKNLLSGSTNGKQIKITATTNGTAITVHTAVAGATNVDEIWIYAYNNDTVTHLLTFLWGGTTEPDNAIKVTVPAQSGRILVCDGILLQNGLIVKAYADSANLVILDGFVNSITYS
jgi:hypothetical protein